MEINKYDYFFDMPTHLKTFLLFGIIQILIAPGSVFAHQPRLVEGKEVMVLDPEISKAYYGKLSGEPHIYMINAKVEFDLYVGILVPGLKYPKRDVVAEIYSGDELLKTMGGSQTAWESYFERFGQSTYWDGGEFKMRAKAGEYIIKVSSPGNDSKYALAIGELEDFNLNEIANAIKLIPILKKDFFEESPVGFIKSVFGWGYILIMYLIAFIFGLTYRTILKKWTRGTVRALSKNIGQSDKFKRLIISLILLIWAITTSWNPILLFCSGFALFEAIFSWCGYYAAIGKSSCPV